MKTLMMLALAGALLISGKAFGEDLNTIIDAAEFLQPDLSDREAVSIAWSVKQHSEANQIDWKLLLAVLYQESSLHIDPQGCALKELACADLGIGQVNWRTWGKSLNLSKVRLVTDYHYAIGTSAGILAGYRKHFEKRDRYWIGRYNSATPEFRRDYQKKVLSHYAKIKADSLLVRPYYARFRWEKIRFSGTDRRPDYGRQAVIYAGTDNDLLYLILGPYREICGTIPTQSRSRSKVCQSRKMG